MKQLLTIFSSMALCGIVLGAGDDGINTSDASENGRLQVIGTVQGALSFDSAVGIFGQTNSFIETYDDGTDVGLWHCSAGVPRIIEIAGGNPGAYLQQG